MLVIEQQPNILVPHEFKPTEWIIRKTDFIVTAGEAAYIELTFDTGSGANAQEITLLGQTFTTDDTSAYSSTTWNYNVPVAQAAQNFANMLRSNGLFLGWSITVDASGAPVYVVRATRGETGELTPFDNDISGLLPLPTFDEDAGTDQIRSTDSFWYQFWEQNDPVSEIKHGSFDPSGRVRIDGEPLARKILGITDPYLLWSTIRLDERASREVYLRFGTYARGEDCIVSYNQAYETPKVRFVNCIRQYNEVLGFRPFSPIYTLPVKWMTSRSTTRFICGQSYEWAALMLQKTPLFGSGSWRVTYTYYDSEGSELDSHINLLNSRDDGVYHVPTGPANPVHPAGVIALASYYTIEVDVKGDDAAYVQYAETITITLGSCNCWAAEVYFLEDAGSWRTAVFEKVDSRTISMGAIEWNSPLQFNQYGGTPDGIRLYHDGGRESYADDVDQVFALVTERITDSNRKVYEDFLRSSRHVILTSSDFLPLATRRIIVDKGSYGTYNRGESTRLIIPFRFNTYMRSR